MKKAFLYVCLLSAIICQAQSKEESSIRTLLQRQTQAWNRGDLEEFMQTYWKSDSLMFVGKSGVTWGWQQTLEHYKEGYPDKTAMGQLAFDIIQIKKISKDHFYVTGKWMLKRAADSPGGHYTLLIKLIKGQWKIIADHSS